MSLDHTRTIDQTEYDAIWDSAWDQGEIPWRQQGVERRQAIPQQLGQGELRVIELRPGLEVAIETSVYWRSLYLDSHFATDDEVLSGFYLAGRHRVINPSIQCEADREEGAGETCLGYLAGARSIEYRPADQPLHHVLISTNFEQLRSLVIAEESPAPLLQPLLQGKSANRFHQTLRLTTAMQLALRQLLDCPYHGVTRRLYLEAKVLELLALQFYQLTDELGAEPTPPNFRPTDVERLHQARDILRQQFDYPPSLLALSRLVGLNDFKLKQGFRQIFGTTVFGYVQTCRMAQAQVLLRDRDLSVALIAERVGYASPSRFSQAFKRQAGVTPSQYRRQL